MTPLEQLTYDLTGIGPDDEYAEKIQAIVLSVQNYEREECAKICERTGAYRDEIDMAYECASNIRERRA